MELLIPGLIFVALMVYVSTKIKKNSARAYEPETFDTPEFSIVKPEGFIIPVDHSEELVFAAYSKEYGRDQTDAFRQASAEIRTFDDTNFEDICERTKMVSDKIVSEDIGILSGAKCGIIETERISNGVVLDTVYKIMAGGGKIYELNVSVLPEHKADYSRRIDQLLDSFILKK